MLWKDLTTQNVIENVTSISAQQGPSASACNRNYMFEPWRLQKAHLCVPVGAQRIAKQGNPSLSKSFQVFWFLLLSVWCAADLTHLSVPVGASFSSLQVPVPRSVLSRLFAISQPTRSTWKVKQSAVGKRCCGTQSWQGNHTKGSPSCRHRIIHCNLALPEQGYRLQRLCSCFSALPVVSWTRHSSDYSKSAVSSANPGGFAWLQFLT